MNLQNICQNQTMIFEKCTEINLRRVPAFIPGGLEKFLDAVLERYLQNVQSRFLKAQGQYVRFRFFPSGEDALRPTVK